MTTMMMVGIVAAVTTVIGTPSVSVSAHDGPASKNAAVGGEIHQRAGATLKYVAVVPKSTVTTKHIWHVWPPSLLVGVIKGVLSWKTLEQPHSSVKLRHASRKVSPKAFINRLRHKLLRLVKGLNSSKAPSATFRS